MNPNERKTLYSQLKKMHVDIFQTRSVMLQKLNDVDVAILSKSYCEKWSDAVKAYNETAQQTLDACFEKLVKESESARGHSERRVVKLQARLQYIGLLGESDLETLI